MRQSEVRVERSFSGTWRWRQVYLVPDHYAWTIHTAGEPDHYLFDGATTRAFVGDAEVSATPGAVSPLRTHVRFTAVVNLDALALPGVTLNALGDIVLAEERVLATCPDPPGLAPASFAAPGTLPECPPSEPGR